MSLDGPCLATGDKISCENVQWQILASWIMAAKLPNSNLNLLSISFDGGFLQFFPRKTWPKNPPPKKKRKIIHSEMFPLDFGRSLVLNKCDQIPKAGSVIVCGIR